MAESRVLYLSRETGRLVTDGWPVPPPLLVSICQGAGSLLAVPQWPPWSEGKGGGGQEERSHGAGGKGKEGSRGAPHGLCEGKEEVRRHLLLGS